MAYIGVQPTAGQYRKLDNISASFNGSTTSFTTSVGGTNVTAGTAQQLIVSLGGVIQQPDTDYTVSTNTITFTTAPTSGLDFFAILMGDALNTVTPSDGSVTTSKLAGSLSVGLTAGSASTPALFFTGDTNNGIFSPSTDAIAVTTAGSERLRVTSAGLVGIGTSAPGAPLEVAGASGANISVFRTNDATAANNAGGGFYGISSATAGSRTAQFFLDADGANFGGNDYFYISKSGNSGIVEIIQQSNAAMGFHTNGTRAVTIDSSQRVGIGTASPSSLLHVSGNGGSGSITLSDPSNAVTATLTAQTTVLSMGTVTNHGIQLFTNSSERARIDTSGRLLVGTSSSSADVRGLFQGNTNGTAGIITISASLNNPIDGGTLGHVQFADSGHARAAIIGCQRDGGTWTSGTSQPTRLTFSTTADGASSPTERMRITNIGDLTNKTSNIGSITGTGFTLGASGYFVVTRSADCPVFINRETNDGNLIEFRQDGVTEGNINVSGTTVALAGAHLSRWSQLPSGVERTEILRGSVLSNIDEMCEWGDEENEQLNRMKVSDVEGDKNVSGVFQAWDDDDDTYTNDFYCAMTGDFIIRIAEGVTVERGDLLMSAGDGTAKPQDDDIIRSKTIAKVTSTNVSCTYDDGSYCVPCVLMAC